MPNLQVSNNLSTTPQAVTDGIISSVLSLATDKAGIGTVSPGCPLEVANGISNANLVKNGGFILGVGTNWWLWVQNGANASSNLDATTFMFPPQSAKIVVASGAGGTNPWDIQFNGGIDDKAGVLIPGRYYTFSLWAKASQAITKSALVRLLGNPYTNFATNPMNLTTAWQKFTIGFQFTGNSTDTTIICFYLGGSNSGGVTFWVDGVTLVAGAASPEFNPLTVRDYGEVVVPGSLGLGTTSPAGLLQLSNSYIVAPAPTGNTTTDLANINAAIAAVTSGGNAGTVYLQAGTYLINGTINITANNGLKLIGAGAGTTTIQTTSTTADVILINGLDITIKDLLIFSNVTNNPSPTTNGIKFTGSALGRNNVENVHIIGGSAGQNYGINMGILLTNNCLGNTFKHISIQWCNTGIQIGELGSGNDSNCNRFYGGGAGSCTNFGVNFVQGCANLLSGFAAEGCGTSVNATGVRFGYDPNYPIAIGNYMIGCYVEGGTYNSSLVRLDSPGNSIIDCFLCLGSGTSTYIAGFQSSAAADCVVLGNTYNNTNNSNVPLPDPMHSISGHTMIQTDNPSGWVPNVGAEATLYLGDSYECVKAVFHNGLNFQTFYSTSDSTNAFRWNSKDVHNNVYNLMTLNGTSGALGIGIASPGSLLQVNGNAAIGYPANTAGPSMGLAVSGSVGINLDSPSLPGTMLDVKGDFAMRENSPAQITANQNDYAIGSYSVLRLTSDGSYNITGFAGGVQGKFLYIINVNLYGSGRNLTLKHDQTSSTANRIYTPNQLDFTLAPAGVAILWYDSTSARWRVLK